MFLSSGLIGLSLCAAACASTLQKTSTTSRSTSLAATCMVSQPVHWCPAASASLSPIPRSLKSTCSSFMAKCLYQCHLHSSSYKKQILYAYIMQIRGISA